MSRSAPNVFNIPPHRAFADALVAGLIEQYGRDALTLARGVVLLPNSRAVLAVRDAFVRQAEKGLLLPRLVPIGDEDLDARLGAALDPMASEPIPPAIDPLHRQLILARMIQVERDLPTALRHAVDAAEAMRLAADLARTLDQLIIEGVDPRRLAEMELSAELSAHWQTSLQLLGVLLEHWPEELTKLGVIDLTDRRNRLLGRLATRWECAPPEGFVVAAGISTAAPGVANVLRVVARMTRGAVVLAGLDPHLSEADWEVIGGSETEQAIATHPQHHLHVLLERMQVARGEVKQWRRASEFDAPAQRSRALSHVMALPRATAEWHELAAADIRLSGVSALKCETPAHEALTIALALRHALETPEQTAGLVTPDRDLARRVVALLARWGINADDSAGLPLSATPIGGLILALTEAVASDFAPVALLSLLKHPLARREEGALDWLDGVRDMDMALRGPRPAAGLKGILRFLNSGGPRERVVRDKAAAWWRRVEPLLEPLDRLRDAAIDLPRVMAVLRQTLDALGGEAIWAGSAGLAVADLFEALETRGGDGPQRIALAALPTLFRQLMDAVSVRPSGVLHPRLFIWGQLEAKLQTADVMILSGLNEGVWPALPQPDPWLAPAIRHTLGLPTLEARIGLAAHDLVGAMGAKRVLLTRAVRDARAPTIASRFWLRLEAFSGGLPKPDPNYAALATQLDTPRGPPQRARRPAPLVPAALRPLKISVTQVDTLKADPYGFYASAILKLKKLDAVDAEPSSAWRGSLIHAALKTWAEQDDCHPDKIVGRFAEGFARENLHPLLTTLWMPRFADAALWIAQRTADARAAGREPLAVELNGEFELCGVTLRGRLDRVDKLADGTLAIMDYKSGEPPQQKQIKAGYALQLGLIGMMAAEGAFPGVKGTPAAFEYWSLGRRMGGAPGYGYAQSALAKKQTDEAFIAQTYEDYAAAVGAWLTGDDPFTAKLVPDYSYGDYEALMRYEEWFGRNG